MRKEMKRKAKQVVKSHYGILLIVCLIGTFVGSEFTNSLDFTKQHDDTYYESMENVPEEEVYAYRCNHGSIPDYGV